MNWIPAGDEILFDPVFAPPLLVALAAVAGFLTVRAYLKVGRLLPRWQNVALLLFRLAGLALVLLLLLRPSRQEVLPPSNNTRITVVAVDTSRSMKQDDVDGMSRLDAARKLLSDAGLVTRSGQAEDPEVRLFEFNADAQPVPQSLLELNPEGRDTRLHKSVTTMLNMPTAGESLRALVLMTDGHDFELVNPVKTGAAARSRQVPIYAVALGQQGKVRDVSARVINFQPYCYVRQKARVAAALRLIGCEYEPLTVQLLRQGQVVQTRRLNADELLELPVEFEVAEPEVGQYEYEIRVQPLEGEVDPENNSAITYLNVIDQQIRVLLVEGDPYWDTTFLQRSLMRNDKFNVDALVQYGEGRLQAIRKSADLGPLKFPETIDQLAEYDVIVLGRAVDRVLNPAQSGLLAEFVKDRSGTIVFSRGAAFEDRSRLNELEPVLWGEAIRENVRLDVTAEGRSLSVRGDMNASTTGPEALPELIAGRSATDSQPLTATLALASSADGAAPVPAVVHRRFGRGQVVSVGVEGLWRWGLNARVEGVNTPFDRFWDQMILWLLAGRDFTPSSQYSFRPNSANVRLGDKAYFRVGLRQRDPSLKSVPVKLYLGTSEVGRTELTASATDPGRYLGEFLPERTGRYRAEARFPDGSVKESRFIVFSENLEETEVVADAAGLRRLCESSGGRLVQPAELGRLLAELNGEKVESTPRTRLRPVWNEAWVFYLAGALFGLDWYLRRRWGLC